MKIEIQSDTSTTNSLTDRLGVGQRLTHIVTWYFPIQELVHDGDFSIKKVLTAKNCADVGTKPVSASVASLQEWYSTSHGSQTPLQDEDDEVYDGSCDGMQIRCEHRDPEKHEHRNRQLSALTVNIETEVQAETNQLTMDKFEHLSR